MPPIPETAPLIESTSPCPVVGLIKAPALTPAAAATLGLVIPDTDKAFIWLSPNPAVNPAKLTDAPLLVALPLDSAVDPLAFWIPGKLLFVNDPVVGIKNLSLGSLRLNISVSAVVNSVLANPARLTFLFFSTALNAVNAAAPKLPALPSLTISSIAFKIPPGPMILLVPPPAGVSGLGDLS